MTTISEQLTPQQRRLAEDHWPDARRAAARYRRRYRRDLDWEGACALALCRAAQAYDPTRGVPFGCYLTPRLRGACIDLLRSAGPSIQSLDVIPAAADLPVGWEAEWHDQLDLLAHLLPPAEGRTLRLVYHDGLSQKDVAEVLALSTSKVSRLHEASLELLRQTFTLALGHP